MNRGHERLGLDRVGSTVTGGRQRWVREMHGCGCGGFSPDCSGLLIKMKHKTSSRGGGGEGCHGSREEQKVRTERKSRKDERQAA